MPTRVNIHAAKTNLSKLIRRAEAGEEIIICRRHKPVARIAPLEKYGGARGPGSHPKDGLGVFDGLYEPGHLKRLRREAAGRRILDAPDMEVPELPN